MTRLAMELMNGERPVWQGSRSWQSMVMGFYLKWMGMSGLPLIVSILLTTYGHMSSSTLMKILFFTVIAWLFIAAIGAIIRRLTIYTVTDRRVNIRTGFLAYSHHEAMLDRIQALEYDQSLIGRMLNYGTVYIETAATDAIDSSFGLEGIRSPGKMRNQIGQLAHEMPTARHGL
jgi:uncharacterized membrane protein YdbT with pleckstrin-like domain